MKPKFLFACLILLFLVACQPEVVPTPTAMPTLDATRLFETAVSLVTADFAQTLTHVPTETPTPTASSTPIPTLDRTRPVLATPTRELPCNLAAAGNPIDVTIPDGTRFMPGMSFSKTWRIQNVGACTWTRQYALTFFSGNSMGAQFTHFLQQPVEPGAMVDLTVDMVAPQRIGLYQSNWMLSDPDGNLFGIGPHGDAPFWVRIEVVQLITPTPTLTPTITNTPVVHISGSATLEDNHLLDLDNARLNPPDESDADVLYLFGGTPMHQLLPVNDTIWAVFGETEPTLGDCVNKTLTDDPIGFDEVSDETYICYRTSGALRGWLLIERIELDRLIVSFLTWSGP